MFSGSSNQIVMWKKRLLENAGNAISKDKAVDKDSSVKELHAKIGQLEMENDFLSVALGRISDSSAKKSNKQNETVWL